MGEKELLVEFVDAQREHVFGILEGLSEEELRRSMLPSGWSCLGLVKHLALGVEHYWLRCIVQGDSLDFFEENGLDGHRNWELQAGDSAERIFSLYREEIKSSNDIIAATPLDAAPSQRDEWWGDWDVTDLRFILLHLIEETACHAGHLDAVCEMIDGRQWLAL